MPKKGYGPYSVASRFKQWPGAFGPLAAVNFAGNMYKRFKSSRRESQSSRQSAASNGINTFQDSSDRLYTRRKVSPRRRRRARKWFRKVIKVVNSALSDRNFRRVSAGALTTTSNNQNSTSFSLCAANGLVGTDDDLRVIVDALEGGTGDNITAKYQLKTAVMDLTVTASSDNDATAFCDFYYIFARKDIPLGEGTSPQLTWSVAAAQVSGGGASDIQGYGMTPFQTPGFCQYWLIGKVQRVSLAPGQTCSLMFRRNGIKLFNSSDVDPTLLARRGLTRAILMVLSGGPATNGVPSAVDVSFNWSRTYCLNVLEDNLATYATV